MSDLQALHTVQGTSSSGLVGLEKVHGSREKTLKAGGASDWMSATMFPADLSLRLHQTGVLAVLILDRPEDAVPVAKALLAGGVNIMKLTLRTPTALDALNQDYTME